VNETEVEAGVPVLSKIPFINRFFTNRISSKTEQTLLILIRPEIIIQQENEDLLFPGLGDSIGASASYLR
jgi:general secretion pathway protein D